MKNFINLSDIDKSELRKIIDQAKSEKKRPNIKFFTLNHDTHIIQIDKLCRN